jgi:hypothetical protein
LPCSTRLYPPCCNPFLPNFFFVVRPCTSSLVSPWNL